MTQEGFNAETIDGETVRIVEKTADHIGPILQDADGRKYRPDVATSLLVKQPYTNEDALAHIAGATEEAETEEDSKDGSDGEEDKSKDD